MNSFVKQIFKIVLPFFVVCAISACTRTKKVGSANQASGESASPKTVLMDGDAAYQKTYRFVGKVGSFNKLNGRTCFLLMLDSFDQIFVFFDESKKSEVAKFNDGDRIEINCMPEKTSAPFIYCNLK